MAADVTSLVRLLAKKQRHLDAEDLEKIPEFMRRRGSKFQDLNMPPPPPPSSSSPLDLNLWSLAAPPAEYQSVCTLDKVKSALERLNRSDVSGGSTSPASSSTTTSSARRRPSDDADGDSTSTTTDDAAPAEMVAAGCPSCLLYVLISLSKPRCPRCDSAVPVPLPPPQKKRKIDLNALSGVHNDEPLRTVKFF
ncbi:uncharacterized protein LOC144700985 [Wolffia australiana]